MILKVKYSFLVFLSLFLLFCRSSKVYQKPDSYQEIADINIHQSPRTIAKEMGELSKKQQRAYKKQLKRTKRQMEQRNKKKLKKIIPKIKTKKVQKPKNTPKEQ